MIGLLQRVSEARVDIDGDTVGRIERGIMVLVGVERGDGEAQVKRLCERLLGYRIFPDDSGRMNHSVADIGGGGVLLVPQFTLAADTQKGMRPSFGPAADPADGEMMFDALLQRMRGQHSTVESGRFGADMQVHLCNDGPVTFWLHAKP